MPELPEVEVTRRRIAPLLLDRPIAAVATTRPSYFFLTPPARLRRALAGRRVEALERRGKYLVARLDDASRLVLHLGMTGQLFSSAATSPRLLRASARAILAPEAQLRFTPDEHTHLRLRFADAGPEVWLRDARKFGKVLWLAPGASDERLDRLGPDALEADPAALHAASRGRRVAVKSFLLDQAVLAGVGNIYADEALFAAGVRPTRPAGRLTRAETAALWAAIRDILSRSIAVRGSSAVNYRDVRGEAGGFVPFLQAYGHGGEPCPRRDGGTIRKTTVAGRGTHWCPTHQR